MSSEIANHHKLRSLMLNNLSFFDIPEKDFALQLTYTDSVSIQDFHYELITLCVYISVPSYC